MYYRNRYQSQPRNMGTSMGMTLRRPPTSSRKPLVLQNPNRISREDLLRFAPTVQTAEAHPDRSEKYTQVATLPIIDVLADHRYFPVWFTQAKSDDRRFTKHMLRFRHEDFLGDNMDKVGAEVFEFILINSHNGSSAYVFKGGVWRLVCSNGMIVGDIMQSIHITHMGDILEQVNQSTYKITEEAPVIHRAIGAMKSVELPKPFQLALARQAMDIRFGKLLSEKTGANVVEGTAQVLPTEEEQLSHTARTLFKPEDFLYVRRGADRAEDIWTIINRVQENMVVGGLSREDEREKRHTTRRVNGIDQTVKLNEGLWNLGEMYYQMMTGNAIKQAVAV